MLRIRALALIFCCLASPFAFGLGLGSLKSSSALNEPFEGRIEIIGAKAEDFDTLTIGIAGPEHFERAGIERPSVLLQLRFTIDDSAAGVNIISVASKDPIREPFLNFLLELNWSNGRLLREYTVLLDPPLYDPNRRRAAPAPVASGAKPASAALAEWPPEPYESPAPLASVSGGYVSGREIGPMVATDTLWPIAAKYRPDQSVTVQQMMLALLRDNPAAFGEANVNRLLRGAILRLPDEAGLRSVSAEEAFAEIKRQNLLWEAYRQPLGAPATASSEAASTEPAGADARLELVAPDGTEGGAAPGSADAGPSSELLREELDATSQTNLELEDKLTEAEEIINLLQRQVSIQAEDLAALQARLAELGVEHGDLGAVDEPTESVPEMIATVEPEIGPETEPELEVDAEPEAGMAAAPVDAVEEDIAQEDTEIEAESDFADEEIVGDSDAAEDIIEEEPGPPAEPGFPANLIPESLASKVPGGALTVLGIVALVILGLFVGVVQFLLKSRSGRAEADTAAVSAPSMDDDIEDTEDPTITAATAVDEDDASEAITSVDDVDDATVEAEADVDEDSTVVTAAEASVSALEESEEDLLEEINVYLAYERFDQAQELVERVIAEHPDRHEYKLRLLEVYYSSNDKSAYEEAARSLHEGVGDADPLWERAVAMWSEMSPERALFEAGAEAAAEPAPAPDQDSAKAFVDITGEDEDESATGDHTVAHAPGGTDDGGLDFDITMGEEDLSDGLDITGVDDGEDEGLEITMGTPEETPADGEMSLQGAELDELALDAGSDLNAEDEEFDFSLEGTAEMDGIAVDDTLDMASVASDDAGELEIGEDASLDDLAMELDAVIDDPSGGELDLDIEAIVEDEDDGHLKTVALDADLGTDLDDDGEKTVVMPMSDDVGRQSDTDEADTKLNLAKAYIELGDTEAARSILDEVASDGNDEQKAEAKALLGQIPG